MYRDEAIENALVWAYRQGYAFGSEALDAYCAQTGQDWTTDYNNVVHFGDKPKARKKYAGTQFEED